MSSPLPSQTDRLFGLDRPAAGSGVSFQRPAYPDRNRTALRPPGKVLQFARPPAAEAARLADLAANGLTRTHPEFSAGAPTWAWQKALVFAACSAIGFGIVAAPAATELALIALMTTPFIFVVLLRVAALAHGLASPRATAAAAPPPVPAAGMPRYTILVPLYRESAVLGTLLDALSALDYPPGELQILLIVEAGDRETEEALAALALPPNASVLVVPPGQPRTKPRALNFALRAATGDFVTVYDAEDIPEPDQLRRALAAFEAGGERLGCVQARLNIYNPQQSWLTRGLMAQTPQENHL